MKLIPPLLISIGLAVSLSGCQMPSTQTLARLGVKSYQTLTLSDSDIRTLSEQSCEQMDKKNKIASASSKYTKRLNKIANSLGHTINGVNANYKVYMTDELNAWAMANGCIRVYSGLMNVMTDNELEGVLGHEMGHVALGHSKKAMQVAYSASIAREAISASAGSVVGALTNSQLGDLALNVINSQFSQSQELAADNYSYDFLKAKGINTYGLVTAFEKLAQHEESSTNSILSSHPASTKRADNIRNRIKKDS